jgi:ParB-like chromosome segregation protein Spo0J
MGRGFFSRSFGNSTARRQFMFRSDWQPDETRLLDLERFDERLQRYRLQNANTDRAMLRSLERYGQMSPVVVCIQHDLLVLIDGFKRLRAARKLKGMSGLNARRILVDEQSAKAAIYTLNQVGRQPQELEEAWIVFSLVRDDGLSQVEAAELLGRHKSWVNRRLAMIERLAEVAQEELRLGLLSPSMARQLTRLPAGNQAEALAAAREASLNSQELAGVVGLLLASSSSEQKQCVLSDPRRALRQADPHCVPTWDPRLSSNGNRVARQLAALLDQLAKMQSWLRYRGRGDLMACDREPLLTGFERLAGESANVAEASQDFLEELQQP